MTSCPESARSAFLDPQVQHGHISAHGAQFQRCKLKVGRGDKPGLTAIFSLFEYNRDGIQEEAIPAFWDDGRNASEYTQKNANGVV